MWGDPFANLKTSAGGAGAYSTLSGSRVTVGAISASFVCLASNSGCDLAPGSPAVPQKLVGMPQHHAYSWTNTPPVILRKRPTGASARAIDFRFTTHLKAAELLWGYVRWRNHLSTLLWPCWRRKWQPTPVFLPGEVHGERSLVGYSPWGHKELETTEWLNTGLATACWYSQKGLDTLAWTRDFCNFVQEDISRSQAYEANRVYLWGSTRQYVCICFKSRCLRLWRISLKLGSNWDLSVWNANKSRPTLSN